jgi:aspartyl-tRNA(Asn)/glutamyl-tRNA(Gln) amidotransferase subunit A
MKTKEPFADYHYLSIAELSELIRQKKVSPVELVSECLKRIERLNPMLNAFITITADQALQEARKAEKEIEAGRWKGALHGIPIGIKDMFDTAGIRTTAAFEYFKDRIPAKDAESVACLKEAGAIVLGKMNMHELAQGTTSVTSYFGAVHNPWNFDYVAGGSSGGSAAAVAAGLCFATLDTDAIGSCRLPAACCGVTGFKATYGLLSTRGILEGEPADETILKLAHAAFTTRTVDDAAIMLNVLATLKKGEGKSQADSNSVIDKMKNLRIGIVNNFKATDEIREAFSKAVKTFHSLGYATTNIDVPLDFPDFDVKSIDEDRKKISNSLFKDLDVLILPTTTDTTPTIKEAEAGGAQAVSAYNTFFCNYYALPAISVPCGFDKKGLPLGLQIVGPQYGENQVLNIAQIFQQSTSWHLKHPIN